MVWKCFVDFFETMKEGINFCNELFKEEGKASKKNSSVDWGLLLEDLDIETSDTITKEIFDGYSDSYGGAGPFTLKEVSFNKKFVYFNFD